MDYFASSEKSMDGATCIAPALRVVHLLLGATFILVERILKRKNRTRTSGQPPVYRSTYQQSHTSLSPHPENVHITTASNFVEGQKQTVNRKSSDSPVGSCIFCVRNHLEQSDTETLTQSVLLQGTRRVVGSGQTPWVTTSRSEPH